jgi:hypothetical protein
MTDIVERLRSYAEDAADLGATDEADIITCAADEIDCLRTALRDLLDLCSHADFKNGVTDATGTMDEGEHWAAVFIDRARAALGKGRT